MLKSIISSLFLLFSISNPTECVAKNTIPSIPSIRDIPPKFYIKENPWALTTTFDIESDDEKLGSVNRDLWSFGLTYHFYDAFEKLQAKAIRRFFAFTIVFDVSDHNDSLLGTVEEEIFTFYPTFQIISSDAKILAKASLDFWGTSYTIYDPVDNHLIATLSRSLFSLHDVWTAEIIDPYAFQKKIDPRLFILLVVFQTDKEYWNAKSTALSKEIEYSLSPSLGQEFEDSLAKHEERLKDLQPNEEDFFVVNSRVVENSGHIRNEESFIQTCDDLLLALDSSDLTDHQKKALIIMLKKRLRI